MTIEKTEKKKSNWGTFNRCIDCGLYDSLYKGLCKPCFDKRGMEYDQADLDELRQRDE
jgi:ribosomal protein S14